MAHFQVLTEPVIKQLSANCDKICTDAKQDAFSKIGKLETEIETQMKDWNEQTKRLEIASSGFEKLTKFAKDWDLNTFVPEVHRDRLLEKIDNAQIEGHLTKNQSSEMKIRVKDAAGFDPKVVPSIHDIADSTKLELATRRRQADKKESHSKMLINEVKSYWKGLKSMSKTAMVTKASNALSGVLGAVGKFGAKNEDGTRDTVKILSGVGDIADVVGTFLPGPASAVTGLLSGILNMFSAGGPSTEDIVKKEFEKMKEFNLELFREQNRFLESKFEQQANLIRDQTSKILSTMDYQTRTIISKIFDSTGEIKSYITSFKDFFKNERITELKIDAISLQTLLDRNLAFANDTRYKSINDATAQLLLLKLDTPKETLFFEQIKGMYKHICLESKALKLPFYTINESRLCTNILYTILAINTKRETLMNGLILMLHQSPTYREAANRYLGVAAIDKENMKTWLHDNIVTKDDLLCPLFVTNISNWNSPLIKQSTLSFIKKIDQSLDDNLNGLTFGYCENELEKNVKDHCHCHQEGSTSIYCDMNGKCECQEHYGRKNCDQRQCILEMNGRLRTSIKITSTSTTTITVWGSSSCTLRILAVGGGGGQ